ncbi:hypothetical protein HWV62_32770 [Athelia sp. TMB]|nr:hypothetical protein HWV62_32770 [Athelia sp. TMB]
MKRIFALCLLVSSSLAQVALPNPPILPPNASAGAVTSSGNTPNTQWSTLLGEGLYFYEAQRSGKLPITNRVSWRNDSALDDGKDVNLDLTGGYYDAGDYIKCTFPLSFAVMSICWGALDYGTGYDNANQTAYLDDMLRWTLDWLIKAHPENDTLYVQVATSDLDNAYWGGDLNIPTPRPSFPINDTHPGTDAAAQASAAFSACSALYANRTSPAPFDKRASLQNDTYAATLLTHAQQLYAFAQNATGGQTTYQTSVPVVGEAYASSSYQDELVLAALWLAGAENSTALYGEAEAMYKKYGLAGWDGVFNWDSKTAGLPVLFAQLAQAGLGGNMSKWQSESEVYFDNIVNNGGPGYLTPGGLLWYDGDSDDASLNPALNAAMLMSRYSTMATSSSKQTTYQNFSKGQLDYFLGKNPMNVPYVVGVNPNAPTNPHSAMASGGDNISAIDTSPPVEAYVLYGAVPGGPSKTDQFFDLRSDWVESEPAMDYSAPFLTLAAMHVGDAADPYYTRLQAGAYAQVKPSGMPCDDAYPCKGGSGGGSAHGLSKVAKIVIGVVVGLVGLVILVLFGLWAWYGLRRRSKKY